MNSEQFTYWLKGFFEISDTNNLSEKQVQIIRDHLDLVFNKVTPDRVDFVTTKNVVDSLFGKPTSKDENLGWGLLNTRFTGVSTNSLCGQDVDGVTFPLRNPISKDELYC